MTREEQIEKESKNRYPYIKGLPQTSAHQKIFIEAAKWADKTMIDKVCSILYELNRKELRDKGIRCRVIDVQAFKKSMEG